MDIPSIKNLIKDRSVEFEYYRAGNFYYSLDYPKSMCSDDGVYTYVFPVPVEDVGDATLNWKDKAIYFMRYIRKAIEQGTFIQK